MVRPKGASKAASRYRRQSDGFVQRYDSPCTTVAKILPVRNPRIVKRSAFERDNSNPDILTTTTVAAQRLLDLAQHMAAKTREEARHLTSGRLISNSAPAHAQASYVMVQSKTCQHLSQRYVLWTTTVLNSSFTPSFSSASVMRVEYTSTAINEAILMILPLMKAISDHMRVRH